MCGGSHLLPQPSTYELLLCSPGLGMVSTWGRAQPESKPSGLWGQLDFWATAEVQSAIMELWNTWLSGTACWLYPMVVSSLLLVQPSPPWAALTVQMILLVTSLLAQSSGHPCSCNSPLEVEAAFVSLQSADPSSQPSSSLNIPSSSFS